MERNGATTVSDRRFIWDGNTLVEQRNGTSTTAAQRYLPQGVQQGTSKFFYTRDHLGSIREVVNNSGSVVARYDYDPYGRRTKLSGTFDSDFGFTGHYFHAPSGLHFAPFRAYSADLGRWISRDPLLEDGGVNLYGYVSNNPISFWDPLGEQAVLVGPASLLCLFGLLAAGGYLASPAGQEMMQKAGQAACAAAQQSNEQENDSDKEYRPSNRDKKQDEAPPKKRGPEGKPPKTGDETGRREKVREDFHKEKSKDGRRPGDNYGSEGRKPYSQ